MDKRKERVAANSILASSFLMLLKLIVGILTGSIGILSDALHSGLDLVATLITFFAIRISKKPADVSHPYGHGKVESISALAETLLLFASCFWVISEATRRLITGHIDIEVTWFSFAVMFISMIVSYWRATSLHKVAKETKSQALEADALNFKSDIYSSGVVILGLTFSYFGVKGADSVAAIAVALFVLYISFQLGKKTVEALIDTAPPGLSNQIKEKVLKIEGVIEVERVRVRSSGASYYVDMTVGVSRKIPLERSEEINEKIYVEVKKIIPDADVVVDIKPIALKDETIAEQIQIITANQDLSVHDISVQQINNKKFVNFDLEVGNNLTLKEAHEKAAELELAIKEELGENLELNIHLEPTQAFPLGGNRVEAKRIEEIKKFLTHIKKQISEIKDITDVSGRRVKNQIYLSFTCILDEKISLEKSHEISEKIEYLLKQQIPNLQKTSIHMEPYENKVRD